jgi:hypothetical protein
MEMKKRISIGLFMVLFLSVTVTYQVGYCEDIAPVRVTSTPSFYKFVGFSTGTTSGMVGQPIMNNKCKSQFGMASRMCTTQEILTSPYLPHGENTSGWINPSHIQLLFMPDAQTSEDWVAFDAASGLLAYGWNVALALAKLNCGGWTTTLDTVTGALFSAAKGSIISSNCSSVKHVACCAP